MQAFRGVEKFEASVKHAPLPSAVEHREPACSPGSFRIDASAMRKTRSHQYATQKIKAKTSSNRTRSVRMFLTSPHEETRPRARWRGDYI